MAKSLTLHEIRSRALAFSKEWKDETSEERAKHSFWDEFFLIFGIRRRRVAAFEVNVQLLQGKRGKIDLFMPGLLLVEHKSRGEYLIAAFKQATAYFDGLDDENLPKYVIVSDFTRIKLYNLDDKSEIEFPLAKLHQNISLFGFLTGHTLKIYEEAPEVNIKAAQHMADLHDALKKNGYVDHPLAVLMVRLMFCMFADHTGLFPKNLFREIIERRTDKSGINVGPMIQQVFSVLDTHEDERQKNLDEDLASFRYVNGLLFKDRFDPPAFDAAARKTLLKCLAFDWSAVSPAIFGSMFQMVMEEEQGKRRQIGAHYTSEKNILKCLGPVLIDPLRTELQKATSEPALHRLLTRLSELAVLDPACGCGNFLVIAYRELRQIEIEVYRKLQKIHVALSAKFLGALGVKGLNVDQMYGIEIEEFPCRVAETALYLIDHLMNMKASEEFPKDFLRLPLKEAPHIHQGNALRIDWGKVVPRNKLAAIIGNPPFRGKKIRTPAQVADMDLVFGPWDGHAELDYVAAWYKKAADFISGASIPVSFVSTNSITQGEQVSLLWPRLINAGLRIHFAHRTFQWSNDAPGEANVYCVVIGWAFTEPSQRSLFDYETPQSEPHVRAVNRINPYLVDAEDLFVTARRNPLCDVPPIVFGSMANHAAPKRKDLEGKVSEPEILRRTSDQLLLTTAEKDTLIHSEPGAAKWIRPFIGSDEFINGIERWCLWMVGIKPAELRAMPEVMKRLHVVKQNRAASGRQATRKLAATPWLFGEIRQPDKPYVIVPRHSSENRPFIPMGMVGPEIIAGDACTFIATEDKYIFGVLQSTMHMAWVRQVCGRLESRYRYSNEIVYNNFPWPASPTPKQKDLVRAAAQALLDLRAKMQARVKGQKPQTLADLYDADVMPPALASAHKRLDHAVDACYGPPAPGKAKPIFDTDLPRVQYLFQRYAAITAAGQLSLNLPKPAKTTRRKKA